MKKIWTQMVTILILIFATIAILPQSNDGFWQEYDIIAKNYILKKGFTKKFSKDDIIKVAKKYKNEKKYNPVKFIRTLNTRHKEWGKEIKKDLHSNTIKPAFLLRVIREEMSKQLGSNYVEAISMDYLLKVFVESKDYSIFYFDGGKKESQINIHCRIEDILKGEEHFQIGQDITISFLRWWKENSTKEFKVGSTYLIPIRPWKLERDINNEYTLHLLESDRFNVYPIENDKINFSSDFLGLENHTTWGAFKKNFFSLLNLYGE